MITVMEQADVPAPTELFQERHQRAGAFGKLETTELFVRNVHAAAADHVADVELGGFVVSEIDGRVAAVVERGGQVCGVLARTRRDANEDVRHVPAAQAVVEFGHDPSSDRGAEGAERPGTLRDGDPEERFAGVANLGALGDEPQPVEIHVSAAQHRCQPRAADFLPLDPGAKPRDRQRAGGLHDRPRVVEDVLDCAADFVVRHTHDFVDGRLHDGEGQGTDLPDGDAVGKDVHRVENDAPASRERLVHRVRSARLDADHFDGWPKRLHVAADARNQTTAANRHEDRRDVAEPMTQDFVTDRSLAGNHQWVVEGVDEDHPALFRQLVATYLGVGVAVPGEDDLRSEIANGVYLDLRGRLRHDDERVKAEMAGSECHALRVIAGAGRDDAAPAFISAQVRDAVVGATQLVTEDRLEIFALEKHLVAKTPRQAWTRIERCLLRHVVDPTGQDQPEHFIRRRRPLVRASGHRVVDTGWI